MSYSSIHIIIAIIFDILSTLGKGTYMKSFSSELEDLYLAWEIMRLSVIACGKFGTMNAQKYLNSII